MNEQFLRHRQIGDQFFDVGSFERAASEFEAALAINPNSTFIRLKLARCWLHLDRWDKALREAENALQTEPDNSDAHYIRSFALRKNKAALASIETALNLDPENDAYYQRRAYLLARLQRFEPALESARRSLELNPDSAGNHRQMAEILFSEGERSSGLVGQKSLSRLKHTEAVFHVQRALQMEPDNARSHALEARLKSFDLDFEASLEKWREALRLDPTDKYAQAELRKAQGQASLAQWQEKMWRRLYGWMPWPIRLPLTWGLMAFSFWWGILCSPGRGLLSGEPFFFAGVFIFGGGMTRLLLRDWLQFVPDRFLDASLRPLKKTTTALSRYA